jgi:hypothetical protein
MLAPALHQAIEYWAAAGVPTAELSNLATLDVRVQDLGGTLLGLASDDTVWLDIDAAGYGWSGSHGLNLASVITHEFGHVLGFEHDDHDDVMRSTLQPRESLLGNSLVEALGSNLAPLPTGSTTRDSLFSQYGRSNELRLGGNDFLASSGKDLAIASLITHDAHKPEQVDRVYAIPYDLDGADDDDDLDLLLGDQAELRVDAESNGIVQQL